MGIAKNGVMMPCSQCGQQIYRRPSEIEKCRKGNTFCGQGCYHAWSRGKSRIRSKNMIACDNCGTVFNRNPAAIRKNNYCSRECSGRFLGRPVAPVGTRKIWPGQQGYVQIRTERGWEREHRVVMRELIGRELYDDETVHHRNGVRSDNRIENLELWSSSHPKGQKIPDLIAWAHEILDRYKES